jgi:hypothetical protein
MNDTVIINLGNAGPHLSGDLFVLDEKLWLTEDKKHTVPDGDVRARFLLGLAGEEIPYELAVSCGLAEAEESPTKKRTLKNNKMQTPKHNKSGDDDGEE